jgi:O-methyltransferase
MLLNLSAMTFPFVGGGQKPAAPAANVKSLTPSDCHFYHTVDVPGFGRCVGQWDLRSTVDAYLGNVPLKGKRVLEIGPASGFVTFEMERRGASVVAVEVTEGHGWDYVPFPEERLAAILEDRAVGMQKMKNSWWFLHRIYNSSAEIWYADIYDLPDKIGRFDVAVMAAVLLHVHSPLQVIAQCARRADTLVITDMFHPHLESRPVIELMPTAENFQWGNWWRFSTDVIIQFLRVLDYSDVALSRHNQRYEPTKQDDVPFFTVVARR